jgi:RNA polymerase sigma-70 factor (ECF subfamily)
MNNALSFESSATDEELARQARRGEHAAFETLVARYQDGIYRLAVRMSHNRSDAEEIAQEAFLHAYAGIGGFRGTSRFSSWLYRIAMNEALMRRRAAVRRPTQSLEVVAPRFGDVGCPAPADSDADPRADDLVEQNEVARRVGEALNLLEDDQRAAFVLRDLEELSAEEAAVILGVTPETVRQRAHRARLKLRDELVSLNVLPRP